MRPETTPPIPQLPFNTGPSLPPITPEKFASTWMCGKDGWTLAVWAMQAIASRRVLRGCEFAVTEARTSKGPEWWAGFAAAGEPFAVSEVSSEDAIARARAYMAAHGWRDDMGAEVGLLLIRAYERGRDDESAARGGIRIHEEQT